MTKFKIGDRVKVISVCGGSSATIGEEGVVTSQSIDDLVIINNDPSKSMFSWRYELLPPLSTFEVGKIYSSRLHKYTVLFLGEKQAFVNSLSSGRKSYPKLMRNTRTDGIGLFTSPEHGTMLLPGPTSNRDVGQHLGIIGRIEPHHWVDYNEPLTLQND